MSTLSRRTFSLSAVGLLSGGLLAACGTESDEVEPTMTRVTAPGAPPTAAPTVAGASPAASPAASPVGDATTPEPPVATEVVGAATSATINFVDFAFEPVETTIAAGVDVTINFTHSGVAQHHYKIDALGIESKLINAGETDSIVVNVAAGTYDSYCPVPGHKELGMVGKLIVQ